MATLTSMQSLLPTPKVVTQGTLRQPRPQPKPGGLRPTLAAPKVQARKPQKPAWR